MSQNFLATSELFKDGYGLIAKKLMRDKTLSIESKAIYGYLASFSGTGMTSFPSRDLMCDELNISINRFTKYRKELIESGYVTIKRERTENGFSKNIYILNNEPSKVKEALCIQNVDIGNVDIRNVDIGNEYTISNSFISNSLNSNSENNILSGKAEPRIPFKEIINYLNEKTGSRYKHTSKKTQSLIKARINESFTLDDFKKVIDIKTDEWKDTDMSKFLRPETLFGTKFESYLNQKQVVKGEYDGPTRYDELF